MGLSQPVLALNLILREAAHASQLSREDTTASVHYVKIALDSAAQAAFELGPVAIAIDHPEYRHATELTPETRASLAADWR